jgi:hypothetical protein
MPICATPNKAFAAQKHSAPRLNGFGRIGRLVFRAIVEQGLLGKETNDEKVWTLTRFHSREPIRDTLGII